MECPHNCHGNGECLSGICHCFPGFLGPDCSRGKRLCLAYLDTDHDKDFTCFQLLCLG